MLQLTTVALLFSGGQRVGVLVQACALHHVQRTIKQL